MTKPTGSVAPGEGERRAQRGYVAQYRSAAAAIYASLQRDDLIWVGLADRGAGVADDVVLGLHGLIVGHQFKTSRYPESFLLKTLLLGADGLLQPLVSAWQRLRIPFPDNAIEIKLVTNDYPSKSDKLTQQVDGHSAAFLQDFALFPNRTLADWRSSRWQPFVDVLASSSGLDDHDFEHFFSDLRILWGPSADFVQIHRLSSEGARLADQIASLLPVLVADPRDKDRWTRSELLQELGWRDSFALRRSHQFPVGAYVQRNDVTEYALRNAIKGFDSGYVALVGPPGSGKSTLLQSSLATMPALIAVRYLAFVPGEGQGIGRGEAQDFLDDLNAQLKRGGLTGLRFRDEKLQECRQQFEHLLQLAGDRFRQHGIRTLIIVDGLDHIPREERPERSLLAELPLPSSIPAGVLIVLGTQRLDITDLKPAVQDQAFLPGRQVVVTPLSREAVYRMTDASGLDPDLPRERIFELGHGQPLVTRYLIEALRGADAERRKALLDGEFSFEGDIEAVYESAWRGIRDDTEVRDVMGYLARAEGPIEPEILAQAVSECAVERTLASVGHLLSRGAQGWSVFHNSFRLFILAKPRIRFGSPDLEYSSVIYRKLAELARTAGGNSPQRWLELRYLARAQQHADVLALAIPARFREQLADARPAIDIQADIRLAFGATKVVGDATDVFRLLLARDEIDRRSTALGYAPGVVDALLAIGDIDAAQAYAQANGSGGYKIVDALLKVGEVDRARDLFDRIEPLAQLVGNKTNDRDFQDDLHQWAERVFFFRGSDQINDAIEHLSEPGEGRTSHDDVSLSASLRFAAARAAMVEQPTSDPYAVARQLKVDDAYLPYLLIGAGLRAHQQGIDELARSLISQAVTHSAFLDVQNGWRRRIALVAAELGDIAMARTIFSTLTQPAIVMMDVETDAGASEGVARAVIEYAELATILGEPIAEVAPSKRVLLRPLQHHANTVGVILGRARDGNSVSQGEVVRAARNALTFLEQVRARGGDEFYAIHQIAAAAPVLGRALVQAAALCGEAEFTRVVIEFDHSFEEPDGKNRKRINLRREVIAEIYRSNADVEGACRRLEPLVSEFREETPELQVEEMAALAATFAHVGNVTRAKDLLRQLHKESLGYALPPKKDPQYVLWRDLLERANAANPDRRPERVGLMMCQLDGMMKTEGQHSGYRLAAAVLTEAAMVDAATGFAAAHVMAARAMLGWDGIVNALLLGVIRRRPDLAGLCAVTWSSLTLPYYSEPYYRPNNLGEFITVAIAAASERDLATVVETLRAAIEAESKTQTRATLLERLANSADQRGVKSDRLDEAVVRWQAEAPIERDRSTPGRYDDLTSLVALEECFCDENEAGPHYEGATAYARLVATANLDEARAMFDRWPAIQKDSRARFALVDLSLSNGEVALARSLVEGYLEQADERATWSYWTGAGKLKYFQVRLRLGGEAVYREAYADLVSELAAGGEYVSSILFDLENVFPTIAETPDWPAMWDSLAEQLMTTREYDIGEPFEASIDPHTEEDLIVALYRWALSLSLVELKRHARIGALRLLLLEGGATLFESLARQLIEGQGDEPAEALQLLSFDTANMSATALGDTVAALVDHPDYAVAVSAVRLSNRWGRTVSVSHTDLPVFYRIHLDGNNDNFEHPTLVDPMSGAMRVENPLGWTFAFENVIESLSRKGVSVEHIRYRCGMFIDGWGGLAAFGQGATDKLQAELGRLDLRIAFFSKPHMVVAARAVRYVAGEMRRAGLIGVQDEPWLLHMMGYPAVRLPALSPSGRPCFLSRPLVDRTRWTEDEQRWLEDVDNDVRPLVTGREDSVIAEITRFIRGDARREFTLERIRAPFFDVGQGEDLSSWIHELPRAIWAESIVPLSSEPASTIVRQFSESYMPEVPSDMLVLCPLWLKRLFWRRHPENWLVYIDRIGRIVAKVIWWRDGGPVDLGKDVIWGEGVLLTVTPEGRAQIESAVGPLNVQVHARRTISPEGSKSGITDRRANAGE